MGEGGEASSGSSLSRAPGLPLPSNLRSNSSVFFNRDLELFLLVKIRWVDDIDLGVVAVAETIDAAEALGHALERRQVADQVIRRDINSDLARARADQIDGAPGVGRVRQESLENRLVDQGIPFLTSHCAGECFDGLSCLSQLLGGLLNHFDGSRKHEDGTFRALVSDRQIKEFIDEFLLVFIRVKNNVLLCPDPLLDFGVNSIIFGEADDVAAVRCPHEVARAVASSRCGRQFHHMERSELFAPFLLLLDFDKQLLKSRLQVSFVMDKQRVLTEEAGVERLGFEADPIAAEQEPTADHVHRPEDNRRTRRIGRPFAVIGEFPSKRADCERDIGPLGAAES